MATQSNPEEAQAPSNQVDTPVVRRLPVFTKDQGRSYYALVDNDVFERVKHMRWTLSAYGAPVNQTTIDYKSKSVYLHHLVLNTSKPIRHLNKDPLDCRRENLVEATMRQIQSTRAVQDNNNSGFKGVYWHKTKGNWRAQVKKDGKTVFSRSFNDPEEAAKAYDAKAIEIHGNQTVTNERLGLYE